MWAHRGSTVRHPFVSKRERACHEWRYGKATDPKRKAAQGGERREVERHEAGA